MEATFWSLVPALIAIVLALATKEVYVSLLVGVLTGAMLYTQFDIIAAASTTLEVMGTKVSNNVNIVVFLVLLGMIVALVQKSGATKAYGQWAASKIKSKRQAEGLTAGLGALIFVDDYFSCLTVGTVMKPVTDKFKISRAKLSYIIDATAAPICIIMPISSWAAAVSSSLPETSSIDGFNLFLQAIPYNFYALSSLFLLFVITALGLNFSKMRAHEQMLESTNTFDSIEAKLPEEAMSGSRQGKIHDLIIPIAVLVVSCICFMLVTGGILESKNIIDAFANCDAAFSLVLGSMLTIFVTAVLYLTERLMSFAEFNACLTEGFNAMVPAILILTLAWTLSGVSGEGYLECGAFVSSFIESHNVALALVPACFYLFALGLAFATGTSWGTFGILIPIIVTVFNDGLSSLMVISIAAVLAGAANGDHISPISDTTILSSASAGVSHLTHVTTQIPYALCAAIPSFIAYLVAGFTQNGWIGLGVALVLVAIGVFTIKVLQQRSDAASEAAA